MQQVAGTCAVQQQQQQQHAMSGVILVLGAVQEPLLHSGWAAAAHVVANCTNTL